MSHMSSIPSFPPNSDESSGEASLLLIEDDWSYAKSLRRTLERREGWRVTVSPTVRDGYYRLETAYYDLVILDWFLTPGWDGSSDGYQFLRRKGDLFPDTWVLVYSGGGEGIAEYARRREADDFVAKGAESVPLLLSAIETGLQACRARVHSRACKPLSPEPAGPDSGQERTDAAGSRDDRARGVK